MQKVVAKSDFTTTWTWLRSRNKIVKKNKQAKAVSGVFAMLCQRGPLWRTSPWRQNTQALSDDSCFLSPFQMASVLSGRVNGFGHAGPRLRLNERPVAGTTEAADGFVCGADTAAVRLNLISAEWFDWFGSKFVCWLLVNYKQPFISFLRVEP